MPLPLAILCFLLPGYLAFVENEPENFTLPNCASSLIGKFQQIMHKVSIFEENSTLLSDILKRVEAPVTINVVERMKEMETGRKSDLVLVAGEANTSAVLRNVLWHAATVVVVLRGYGKNPEVDLQELWKEKALNGYVAVEEADGVSIYGYEPYERGSCNRAKAILLGKCEGGKLKGEFRTRRISNGNGCRLDALVIRWKPNFLFPPGRNACDHLDGSEAIYFNTFAEKLNFTTRYSIPADGGSWGTLDPPRGILGNLLSRNGDFGFGFFVPTTDKYVWLDMSRAYGGDESITFFVPAGVGPGCLWWLEIVLVNFSLLEWTLISVSFVSVTVLLCTYFPPTTAFICVLSSFLGNHILFPRKTGLRRLLLFWIIYSFVISTVFKAHLGSKVTQSRRPSEMDSLSDLLDSDLKVTGHSSFLDIYRSGKSSSKFSQFADRYIVVNLELPEVIAEMLADERMAYLSGATQMKYELRLNPSATGKLHAMRECIWRFYPVVVLQKNSPFTAPFDKLLSRTFESGIGIKWKSLFVGDPPIKEKRFHPLELKQFFVVFLILLVGHTFAFLALLAEIAIFRWKRRQLIRKGGNSI